MIALISFLIIPICIPLKPGNIIEYDDIIRDYVWVRRRGRVLIRRAENESYPYYNIYKFIFLYKTRYCVNYYLDLLTNLELTNVIGHSLRNTPPKDAYLTHLSLEISDHLKIENKNETVKWEISILYSFYNKLKSLSIEQFKTDETIFPIETYERLAKLFKEYNKYINTPNNFSSSSSKSLSSSSSFSNENYPSKLSSIHTGTCNIIEPIEYKKTIKCMSGEFGRLFQTLISLKSPIILSDPINGCEINNNNNNFRNDKYYGKIIITKRGDCPFINKAKYAESVGASGLVVIDNSDVLEPMTINNNNENIKKDENDIKIPCVSMSKSDGEYLLDLLKENENIWIEMSGGDYGIIIIYIYILTLIFFYFYSFIL